MKKLSSAEVKQLTALVIRARDNAYAPYSDHPVGAALVTKSGRVFTGANSETAHYDCIHAEGAAIAAMTSAGEREIRAIMVMGPSTRRIATPCGNCRQRIREFADKNTIIYAMRGDGKSAKVYTLGQLLPDSFGPENLAELGHGPLVQKNKQKTKKKK